MTLVFIPKETRPGERRVACSADSVRRLVKLGLDVAVERGAGESSAQSDADLETAGARLVGPQICAEADLVLRVQPPTPDDVGRMKHGAMLAGFLAPHLELATVQRLAECHISAVGMELIPRITRAQSMDALSSQATVAGYKAVVLAAAYSPRLFPLLMTAAGTVRPARVVVFGAGVAGLQAIATAKRLGCIVEATDVRRAAKEQVESLGAKFIDVEGAADLEGSDGYAKQASEEFLQRQREEVARRVAEADIAITTALVPGRRAPLLITEAMVHSMRRGSVIVDLAVESGGNCALSVPGEIVEREGVILIGLANLPSTVPFHASELYARNLVQLVAHATPKGSNTPRFDPDDEILGPCLVTHGGEVRHKPTAEALQAAPSSPSSPSADGRSQP